MSFFGPIQLVAFGFPSAAIPLAVIDQLRVARDTGAVRLIDGVFASKDADGNLVAIDASDLGDEELALLGTLARALFGYGVAGEEGAEIGAESGLLAAEDGSFGLTAEDLEGIAEDVPADSAVLFLLIEHQWALGVKDAVLAANGIVIANGFITPATLVEAGASAAE